MAIPKRENQTGLHPSRKRMKRQCHYGCNHRLGQLVNNSVINTDRSVNLPDDVVDNIFSFLPLEKAIQIGILSTRFRNSWLFNRKLVFDKDFARGRSQADFKSIVNRVFDIHAGTNIQSFRLYFDPTGESLLVETWIKKAVEKGVEELDLNFCKGGEPFKLSSNFIDIQSLRILNLAFCQVDLPPKLRGLTFLNTLLLRKICITRSFMDTLFCHCLSLKTLDLASCYGIRHLRILAQNLKGFNLLKIGDCVNLVRIDINAPTLCSIHYCGKVGAIKFVDFSQLNDVMLNFTPPTGFMEPFKVGNLVPHLTHVGVFTTTSIFLECLTPRYVDGEMKEVQFCFWDLKEFQLFMEGATYCNLFDVVNFLKKCPCLEKIFIDLNEFSFVWGPYWELHQQQRFEQCTLSFPLLKIIKLQGFKFQIYELMLVKFFLESAFHLEKLVLVTHKPSHGQDFSPDFLVHKQLLQSWKAYTRAEIAVYEHFYDISLDSPKHLKIWY